MADINGLIADPDFQSLDPATQRQALARVSGDQSFNSLSDDDTSAFIGRMKPQQNADWTPQAAQARASRQAQQVSAAPVTAATKDPAYVMAHGGPKDPGDAIFQTGTTPQKIHRAAGNVFENLAPTAAPAAVASTIPFLASLLGGTAGGIGAKQVARAAGASPDWSDVAGDVGSFAGGIAGGSGGGRLQGAAEDASGFNNLAAKNMRYPATAAQSIKGAPGTVKPGVPRLPLMPWLTNALTPKGDLGTVTNPGPFSDFIGRQAVAPEPELGSPENPGMHAKIPTRMPKPPAPTPELGSPENPGWVVNIPNTMPKEASPQSPAIISSSDAARARVGNEGRAATWKTEDLYRIAGDSDSSMADRQAAITQMVRRGLQLPPNYRYLMGDPSYGSGTYNPRDVTTFSPEGTPIRSGGKVPAATPSEDYPEPRSTTKFTEGFAGVRPKGKVPNVLPWLRGQTGGE